MNINTEFERLDDVGLTVNDFQSAHSGVHRVPSFREIALLYLLFDISVEMSLPVQELLMRYVLFTGREACIPC